MRLEWYVINGNFNNKTTEMFNVFDNIHVQESTEKAIRKYLRCPKRFEKRDLYGFDALVKEIDSIIKWQEWCRCEYEFCAYESFFPENAKKWDCYEQCRPNMVSITHEVIRQYKEQLKEKNAKNKKEL